MKKRLYFLIALAMTLSACQPKVDALIGVWTVDKVNVQFDESRGTPELVKQMGEMEKQNVITISKDSILVFKGLDSEWQSKVSLLNDSTLCCEGRDFGIWKDGKIITRTNSPLGEIIVIYRKE